MPALSPTCGGVEGIRVDTKVHPYKPRLSNVGAIHELPLLERFLKETPEAPDIDN